METTTPTPLELAKLHETKMVLAKIGIEAEKRCIETLLIGKTARNRSNRGLSKLIISAIELKDHGVQVWGKKTLESRNNYLIGGLTAIELTEPHTRIRPQRRARRCQLPPNHALS